MIRSIRHACAAVAFLAIAALSFGQATPGASITPGSWQPLVQQPPFGGAVVPILLTDGSVMVQDCNNFDTGLMTNHWWKLTPDISGSYVNGTWTQLADAPAGFAPLFYASAVLADGRVVVQGGEYNANGNASWSNLGAVYNPTTNTWTPLPAPAGWANIGDAQCVVLPDGKYMVAQIADTRTAVLDPVTMLWTPNATTGKVDRNDEEGWTLLPDGTVLTVDCSTGVPGAEKWISWLNQWVSAGATPAPLTSEALGEEIGAAVLMYDGRVFQFGANSNTAIYTPPATPTDPGAWVAGTPIPGGLGQADGPAALMPNGNMLFAASPGLFNGPTSFFESDGTAHVAIPGTPHAPYLSCYQVTMLVLPNGQVMVDDSSNQVQIYTPVGAPQAAWRPTITTAPASVLPSNDYTISGTQFNGLSQANFYGDDWGNASNYPIVRITNDSTSHVFYCRTHDHSTMAVATGSTPVSTHFEVPAGIELGASHIEVVANGIASTSQAIYVGTPNTAPDADAGTDQTIEATGPSTNFTLDGTASSDTDNDSLTYEWYDSSNTLVGSSATVNLSAAVGVYTYTLKVSDGTDTDTDTVQITIHDTTAPVFGAIADVYATATGPSGAVVTFSSPSATDLVDGAVAGTCVPPSGSTFALGGTLVNVSATDAHSNTGYGSFHVYVTVSWSGFLSPFPKQQFKMGSTIPIKFQLTGASAGVTNLVATGSWAKLTGNTPGPYTTIGTFKYDPLTTNYVLNWKTTGRPKGTYRIKADLGDGVLRTVDVILK